MSGTARVIPSADVFARIGTREPYYALRTVAVLGDASLEADVPVEVKSARELGPITAAEAGRHLGLLASCAVAEANPSKALHYYLARSATLERSTLVDVSTATKLEARATGELFADDAGHAQATLHVRGGATVFTLDIDFSVLPAAKFERLFDSVKRDLRKSSRPPVMERRTTGELKVMRKNPYGAPLALTNVDASPGADLIEATFGPIKPTACNGHYPMYPVLPTGIVMSALSQLSGVLLVRRKGDVKYVVRHATARADNLALEGETVKFESRFVGGSSKNLRFECKANCGIKSVGTVSLTLSIV